MNPYLAVVVGLLLARFALDAAASVFNLRRVREALPEPFQGWYDASRYRVSQRYLRAHTRFELFADAFRTALTVAFITAGGFNAVDRVARLAELGPVLTGLLFGGILLLGVKILHLPFDAYRTFVIESRFGFNRTTPRTFCLDAVKAAALTAAIGGPLFAAVIWLFERAGGSAWVYAWATVTGVRLLLAFAGPALILPLFHRFVSLEEGPLRSAIRDYADAQNFRLAGIYSIDGSRRSTKSNAFFTGFGRFRRVALYDTLIERHTVPELVAVLAHEIGHFRKGHVPLGLARSTAFSALALFLLSLFIGNTGLFDAFSMDRQSVYAAVVFFGFLFTPLAYAFSVLENLISRRQEYAADRFAAQTTGDPQAFATALKKLSVHNLSNLTPHPLQVALHHSHPPVLRRLEAIRACPSNPPGTEGYAAP